MSFSTVLKIINAMGEKLCKQGASEEVTLKTWQVGKYWGEGGSEPARRPGASVQGSGRGRACAWLEPKGQSRK